MSRENVDIARQAIEAWNDGDLQRLGALYEEDAVVRTPDDWIEARYLQGRDAIIGQFADLQDLWQDSVAFEIQELVDAGDRVVVHVVWRLGVRELPIDQDLGWIYTMRDGLITSLEMFRTWEDARLAAGLSD